MTDYNSMKNSELVSAYNQMAETAGLRGIEVTLVKRFKDHSIGVERCRKLEERLASHAGAAVDKPATPEKEAGLPYADPTEGDTANDNVQTDPAKAESTTGEEDTMAKKAAKKTGAKKKVAKKTGAVKKAKTAKPAKQKFGHDKVIVEVGACNRFKGSKAEKLYGQMARFMENHPKATVAEVIEKTDYRRQDYLWDLERKTIKVRSA